jgi:hypothetical protein
VDGADAGCFREKRAPPLSNDHSDLFGTNPIRIMQRYDMSGLRLKIGGIESAGCAQLLDSRINVSAQKLV